MSNNKKIHIRNLIVVIVIIVLIVVGIAITMSRYMSGGQSTLNADIAFYVVKEEFQVGNIFLTDLYPSNTTFDYTFTVTNAVTNPDGSVNTAETSIDYVVELEATTNLPLEFSVYRNGTKLTGSSNIENTVVLDETGESYIRKIKVKKGSFTYNEQKTDTYKVAVKFPIQYAEYEEYEGMIDNINIKIDSKQKIN